MKILFLMPYSPIPANFGGAIRVYHMLKALTRSHDVTIATFGSRNDEELLRQHFGDRVRTIRTVPYPLINKGRRLAQLGSHCLPRSFFFLSLQSRAMQRTIDDLTGQHSFDAVHLEFPMMGMYSVPPGVLKLLDAHNVEYDNFHRMEYYASSLVRKLHYRDEYLKIRKEELAICRAQDHILVTSTRDRAMLEADVPLVQMHVVPNGVDTAFFTPSREQPEPHSMVFTGMMGYVPNYDAMLYFLDEILPLIHRRVPDAKITIVGKGVPRELLARRSSNVIITGCVDDVRPYLRRASVYVVPLRMGGGTRLKVLEAMAVKKPIVTTTIGCEGINCPDGESVLVADTPQIFSERVIELMRNPRLAQRLTDAGYDLVRSQYDWSMISGQVTDIYESLAGARARGTRTTRTERLYPSIHATPAIANT